MGWYADDTEKKVMDIPKKKLPSFMQEGSLVGLVNQTILNEGRPKKSEAIDTPTDTPSKEHQEKAKEMIAANLKKSEERSGNKCPMCQGTWDTRGKKGKAQAGKKYWRKICPDCADDKNLESRLLTGPKYSPAEK